MRVRGQLGPSVVFSGKLHWLWEATLIGLCVGYKGPNDWSHMVLSSLVL